MTTQSWQTEFLLFQKHILHLNFEKDTTHVLWIQNYELSGFIYIMLNDGGNSS